MFAIYFWINQKKIKGHNDSRYTHTNNGYGPEIISNRLYKKNITEVNIFFKNSLQ